MEITPLPALELPHPQHFGSLAPDEAGLVLSLITARSYGQHNPCPPPRTGRVGRQLQGQI